jgi:hypothetical protein
MSDETQTEDVQKLASELIEKLSLLANKQNGKNVMAPNGDIILQDEPEKWIKIDNKVFYQMIYTDVKKLKKENEILLAQYLDDMKPTLKSVDDNIKELGKNVNSIRTDVDYLMKNRPKTFKSWISEKGQLAENSGSIFKFIFYALIVLYILSTAMPAIFTFISKIIGIETGVQ